MPRLLRRLAATLLALLALAAVVILVPAPRQERFAREIHDEAACTAAGGQWNHFHLPRPGEPKSCLLPATDTGRRCLSSWNCSSSVCRPDPAASETEGFQVGRCDGTSWRGDCGRTLRYGVPRTTDCPLE
jgi:hypothetical protein